MKKKRFLHGALFGVLVMLITALGLGAVFALLLSKGVLPMSILRIISLVTTFAACFAGAFWAGKTVDEKKLPAALLAWGIYLLGILVFRGIMFQTVGEGTAYLAVVSLIAAIFGGAAAAGKS